MTIPIKKARQLLGKTGEKMTDEEIEKLDTKMRILANALIDRVLEDIKNGTVKKFTTKDDSSPLVK